MAKRKNKNRNRKPFQPVQKPLDYSTAPNRTPRVLVLDWGFSDSARCVVRAGGVALTKPPHNDRWTLELIHERPWDALLLTGGSDIDPRRYGEAKIHKTVYGIDEVRDHVELLALKEARRRNVPVLGICRGHQMIVVEAGGKLNQHIGRHHQGGAHFVTADEDSILHGATGERFSCISLHHQSVRVLPNEYRLTGTATDGTPEVVEGEGGRCLGVQFHPEMASGRDYSRGIFRWLVEESAVRSELPIPEWPPAPVQLPIATGWSDDAYWDDFDADDFDARMLLGALENDVPRLPAKVNRPAGTQTIPHRVAARKAAPISYRYVCRCHGIEFDYMKDRDDHEVMYGGKK